MKIKLSLLTLSVFILFSCEFKKSISQDLQTGLATEGSGLSCDQVFISDGEQKLSRSTFTYGEKFYINFENIEGFQENGGKKFPGMQLLIVSEAGDTVMANEDLYAEYTDGIDISPLLLQAHITVADPIHSNNDYTFYINIWDKKGKGTFNGKMNFNVAPNSHIKVKSNGVSCNEIYLFSQERKATITGNTVKTNENIFLIFEGLEGFTQEHGKVYFGLSILAKDAKGEIVINEKDLAGESGMELSQLKDQLAPSLVFKSSDIKSPVTCTIAIWDKKGDNRIEASTDLNIE